MAMEGIFCLSPAIQFAREHPNPPKLFLVAEKPYFKV